MPQVINGRGWECPRPIIETKRVLDIMKEGEVMTIVDNKPAVSNLVAFAENLGYGITYEEVDGDFFVTVKKEYSEADAKIMENQDIVLQISTDKYGTGGDELGENLMKAYLYALTEVTPMPNTILFINSGVFLTTEGSPVLDSLEILESEGVEILSCGACLNFYGLEEQLQIGQITNMYAMVEKMHNASNAIKI